MKNDARATVVAKRVGVRLAGGQAQPSDDGVQHRQAPQPAQDHHGDEQGAQLGDRRAAGVEARRQAACRDGSSGLGDGGGRQRSGELTPEQVEQRHDDGEPDDRTDQDDDGEPLPSGLQQQSGARADGTHRRRRDRGHQQSDARCVPTADGHADGDEHADRRRRRRATRPVARWSSYGRRPTTTCRPNPSTADATGHGEQRVERAGVVERHPSGADPLEPGGGERGQDAGADEQCGRPGS